MELLRITPETELELSTDGKTLTITPSGGERKPKSVRSALDRVNAKHGKALRRLAQ